MIINLLPHSINIRDGGIDVLIPPSHWALVLKIREGKMRITHLGVPIYNPNELVQAYLHKGKVRKPLPAMKDGVFYIYTKQQAESFHRDDMLVPKTAPHENPERRNRKIQSVRGLRFI